MVCRIVPESPTAQPVLASEKSTQKRFSAVPLVCSDQVSPPFQVPTIVPSKPAAQAVFASAAATVLSKLSVPLDCELQVKPGEATVRWRERDTLLEARTKATPFHAAFIDTSLIVEADGKSPVDAHLVNVALLTLGNLPL